MAKKDKKKEKTLKTEFEMLNDEESRRAYIARQKEQAKAKIAMEDKMTQLNLVKIRTRWREIMKQAKTKELTGQIESLQQIHDRHIDAKNAAIKALQKDLDEAQEQYSTALQSHVMNVDTLLDLHQTALATLQKQFEDDISSLEMEFDTERIKLQTVHAKEKTDILGIMFRMDQEFQDAESDAKHEFSSIKDDVKNKNLEEKHALRIQLEGTVEELWRQFQGALTQYTSSTEERKRQFEELKQKDQKNAKDIETQMKKLMKLQETTVQYKTKFANNVRDFEDRNKGLREDKETIQRKYSALKDRMIMFREMESRKLTDMAILSNFVLKELQKKVQKAERILRIAEMNRKLETEEEKILPFYKESVHPTEDEAQISPLIPKEFKGLDQFHKRYNKVMLDRMALGQQREKLKEENTQLRIILKQYLDGISVSESVMNEANPLFVINDFTNAPLKKDALEKSITYVEAAHHLAKQMTA